MPVLRAHGALSPTWGGYVTAEQDVSPVNDASILDADVWGGWTPTGAVYEKGVYVMGHWQWAVVVAGLGVLLSVEAGTFLFLFAMREDIALWWAPVGIACAIGGFFLWIMAPQYYPYGKFVVFDQNSGLVHIPRLLWGYDRIRFQDASFVLVHRIHYGGFRSSFYWYLYRPGMDLVRDSLPAATLRWLLRLSFNNTDQETQEWWKFVVRHMAKDHESLPGLEWTVEEVRRKGRNPFKETWYWQYRRFDPARFTRHTEPNWERDEEGVWRRLEDHPWARFRRPLMWLLYPAGLLSTIAVLSLLSLATGPFEWDKLYTSGAVLLGSAAVMVFYYMLSFDVRGSRGVPLYDEQGIPVGSLGVFEHVKRWFGFAV